MPRKLFRKYMPSVDKVREVKALGLFGEALFHPALWHLNRRSAAGGLAVGLFCGLIPGPLQMLGAAIVCLLVRVNLPVAIVTTLYTNPFTIEPFQTTKGTRGTGLGLAVTKRVVEEHRGRIRVESNEGTGATFHIFFPLVTKGPESISDRTSTALIGGPETILVAEDDEVIRTLTRSVLTEFGYQVIEARNGEEAVRIFGEKQESIDLLLFDVIMPRMNGKAAYEEILKVRPAIRALFMSGYSADMISQEGILEKDLNFISKPRSR